MLHAVIYIYKTFIINVKTLRDAVRGPGRARNLKGEPVDMDTGSQRVGCEAVRIDTTHANHAGYAPQPSGAKRYLFEAHHQRMRRVYPFAG